MVTANLRIPSAQSQESLVRHVRNACEFLNNNFRIREQLLDRDLAYAREAKRNAKKKKGVQDITIPIVMPQVESASAFLASIFLTGYPIFPCVSKPQLAAEALQMETLVGEHSVKFGWPAELLLCFKDGLKYNLMAAECAWDTKRVWSIENDAMAKIDQGNAVETYFSGNKIKRLNPYNIVVDTRVDPAKIHTEGEFAGYTELLSRIQLKQLLADLGAESTMNAKAAFESGEAVYSSALGTDHYYIPEVNPNALIEQNLTTTNWFHWAGLETASKIKYNNMYEVTTLYTRIIPADFKLETAARNTVQIYKLIVVNRSVLVYCAKQTNAHNNLGIIVCQPIEDGLGWQTKSFGENVVPLQEAATALYNSALESQRRKVYDRIFYDPSRIDKKDIDTASSVARIPVKQQAYGTPLNEAVYSQPYRDEGVSAILQMSGQLSEMADVVNGQNKVQRGQFQRGNKTRHEFQEVMDHSNSRMSMMALLMEYRFFQPIKEIIKLNILQFQPPTTLYNRNTKEPVKIDPVSLRSASMEFKLADGILPVDKIVNLEGFNIALQLAQANPAMAAEFDLMGMVMYYLQQNGASWIADFKRSPQQQTAVQNNAVAMENGQATTGPAA